MRETVTLTAKAVKWLTLFAFMLVAVQAWINPKASPEYLNVMPGGGMGISTPHIPAYCWTTGKHEFPTGVYATINGNTAVYGAPWVGRGLNNDPRMTVIAFCKKG